MVLLGVKVILSASRRTDILAFHSQWLETALDRGFLEVPNPYNPKQKRAVSLKKEDISAIVFWTRNPQPSVKILKKLEKSQIPFYLMITATNYPEMLEKNVPKAEELLNPLKELSSVIGRERMIWRYDPILFSNLTDAKFHTANFERLAKLFSPVSFRVIVSLFDEYPFVMKKIKFLESSGFFLARPRETEILRVLGGIGKTAASFGCEIQNCCEGELFEKAGIKKGACIDTALLNRLFGLNLGYQKDKSQRPSCLCGKSIDIGKYDSCPGGCIYCYANKSLSVNGR